MAFTWSPCLTSNHQIRRHVTGYFFQVARRRQVPGHPLTTEIGDQAIDTPKKLLPNLPLPIICDDAGASGEMNGYRFRHFDRRNLLNLKAEISRSRSKITVRNISSGK